MKSSEFMDKQMMELSTSKSKGSFNFFSPDEESEEEFDDVRSYDFHPIRPLRASHSQPSVLANCSYMDFIDYGKVTHEKVGVSLVSEINQTIKEHFDNLLHSVDGLSARLSQLENKTCQLENAVDDVRFSAEYDNGKTDGKLRQLENIVREVQDGIHFIRNKPERAETQLQLAKLPGSKSSRQSEDQKTAVQAESALQASSSVSEQSPQPLLISGAVLLSLPTLSPDAPSSFLYQNATPVGAPIAMQLHTQILQNPILSTPQPQPCHLPTEKTLEVTYQQYNVPHTQQAQPPHPVSSQLCQLYQPTSNLPQVSQSTQPPWIHHPEETSPMPSHNYPPSILQSSSKPPVGLPMQLVYMDSSWQMHSQTLRMPNSEFPPGYSHALGPDNFSNMHSYSKSLPHYSSSTMKPSPLSPSSSVLGGGSNYTQLPKAQILPHALPTASSVDTGSSSGRSGNKVPIDDVIDRVTTMGFRRDLVRATVKKLTDNGQSMDFNMVLDKLMNNNGAIQPEKAWFGR